MGNIYPYLRYADAEAAVRFLKDAFGFEEHEVFRGPDGCIVHAQLRVGSGMIMLGAAKKDDPTGIKTPRELNGTTMGIYVSVEDVDAHYAQAKKAGAKIALELRDMEYGSREYTARDPEGHDWSFGTYAP